MLQQADIRVPGNMCNGYRWFAANMLPGLREETVEMQPSCLLVVYVDGINLDSLNHADSIDKNWIQNVYALRFVSKYSVYPNPVGC